MCCFLFVFYIFGDVNTSMLMSPWWIDSKNQITIFDCNYKNLFRFVYLRISVWKCDIVNNSQQYMLGSFFIYIYIFLFGKTNPEYFFVFK